MDTDNGHPTRSNYFVFLVWYPQKGADKGFLADILSLTTDTPRGANVLSCIAFFSLCWLEVSLGIQGHGGHNSSQDISTVYGYSEVTGFKTWWQNRLLGVADSMITSEREKTPLTGLPWETGMVTRKGAQNNDFVQMASCEVAKFSSNSEPFLASYFLF